jgi:glycosyltransferase involved in cell wall biosynthesis
VQKRQKIDMPLTHSPLIHVLLPHKESFTLANGGAVAMTAKDMTSTSTWADNIHIFGKLLHIKAPNDGPLLPCYVGIKPQLSRFYGRNIGLARGYLQYLKTTNTKPDWLEIHGRCHVAAYIAKARPDLKIALILHNDPREMKGGETTGERADLCRRLTAVFAVSQYIMDAFNDGLYPEYRQRISQHITPHGIDKLTTTPPPKSKRIAIIGRMVKEKGMLEFAQALAQILPKYPDWSAQFIGSKRFEKSIATAYETAVSETLAPISDQTESLGFLPIDDVRHHQQNAAIAAIPSIWQEPAGRVVLESMAAGCAIITTRKGGIPEYAENRALIVDEPTPENFAKALELLIGNPDSLAEYQRIAWQDYPFTLEASITRLDAARKTIIDTGTS